jgi:2-Cys peroxiredoxin 5
MASAIAAAAQAAHSVASSVLSITQIKPGATLPEASVLKENAADESIGLDLDGKVLIVRLFI